MMDYDFLKEGGDQNMEKLITIFIIDATNGDSKEEFMVIPAITVRQLLRKRRLEGFSLFNVNGKRIPHDADIYAEAINGSPKFLALWNGGEQTKETLL